MGKNKLKPCPFCGSHKIKVVVSIEAWVECETCHAMTGFKASEDGAIEAWNRRAKDEGK